MLERTRIACRLARQAGSLIRDAMAGERRVEFKSAVDLVTDTDRRAEELILEGLRAAFPGETVVAEEEDSEKGSVRPCWCVDPLDGTVNFVHALPHFAVSIAYLDDQGPAAAAVYDPSKDELFHATRSSGAFLGESRLSVSAVTSLDNALLVTGFPYDRRAHVDFYLEYFREFIVSARDLRRYGSASLDMCYVAAGRFDGFFEWKLNPWDTAAGWLLVEEAGGRVSDFDGAPYDPWLPRVLATNGAIHGEALDVLARIEARRPERQR